MEESTEHLLTKGNLTEVDLVSKGDCALCAKKLALGDIAKHVKDHLVRNKKLADGTVLWGCRLDTPKCSVDKAKPTRYHFHCRFCFYSHKMFQRVEIHMGKCTAKSGTQSHLDNESHHDNEADHDNRDQHDCTDHQDNGKHQNKKGPKDDLKLPRKTNSQGDGQSKRRRTDGLSTLEHSEDQSEKCPICEKKFKVGYLKRHMSTVHAPHHLASMLVDHNNKIFLVRKGRSGSGVPIHVLHSSVPGDYRKNCPNRDCRDALKVALNNRLVGFQCDHIQATKVSPITTKPPFDLSPLPDMNFSDQMKQKITELFQASREHGAPLIVLFEDGVCSPKSVYLSVFESKDDPAYATFNRVVTTFNVGRNDVNCPCSPHGACVHRMITKMYLRQIEPHYFEEEGPIEAAPGETDETTDRCKAAEIMTDYILSEKKVPLVLDPKSRAMQEIVPSSFEPEESLCFQCGGLLTLRQLKNCKLYSTTTSSMSVPLFVKECPNCGLVFRALNHETGWINRDNFHVVSVRLLETVLSRLLAHTSLVDSVTSLQHEYGTTYNTNVLYDVIGFYLSIKETPFNMICGICGVKPKLLCFDATRKVHFKIPHEYNPSEGEDEFSDYTDLHKRACKLDILKTETSEKSLIAKSKLSPHKDWLPFLDTNTIAQGPPPKTTRKVLAPPGTPKHPFSIKHDILEEIRAGGPSKLTLRNLCRELGITPLPTTKRDLTDSIINTNVPYDEFVTKFFKLGGRSGGVARGFCEHGIVYVLKLLTGPEGASDYFQMLKSFDNAPVISVIDFAPQVAKYISALEPSFLGPDGGGILPNTPENIQRVLDGEQISIPGLIDDNLTTQRYLIIDPFHRVNHHQPQAALHDASAVKELKCVRANLAVQEQRNALTKKYGHILNSMSPERFLKTVLYITCMENLRLNQKNQKKMRKFLWQPSLHWCQETSSFVTEQINQKSFKSDDKHKGLPKTENDRRAQYTAHTSKGKPDSSSNPHDHEEKKERLGEQYKSTSTLGNQPGRDKEENKHQNSACGDNPGKSSMGDQNNHERTKNDSQSGQTKVGSHGKKPSVPRFLSTNVTLLENPNGSNLCWLNSISYMLHSAGLDKVVSDKLESNDDLEDGLTNITRDYFNMLAKSPHVYNQNTHLIFAQACLEELREVKNSREKHHYILGEPQDVDEVLSTLIFPLLVQASVPFDPAVVYYHEKDSIDELQKRLSFAAESGEQLDYVFAVPVRDVLSESDSGLNSNPFASIGEFISVTARCASRNIIIKSNFRLASFISFYGRIDRGHYVTYSYDKERDDYLMFDGAFVQIKTNDQFMNHAQATSQLVLYQLETRETVSCPSEKKPKMGAPHKKENAPTVDLTEDTEIGSGPSRVWLYADPQSGRLEMHQAESLIIKDNDAELNGTIINSFSSMLVKLYYDRHRVLVTNVDTLHRVKGLIPPLQGPFIQVINLHQNHWVLFTNLRQRHHDCVLIFDSNYSRGKFSVLSEDYMDITHYDESLISICKQLKPDVRTIKIVDVEQQKGIVNCGVHALFNAWSIITSGKVYSTAADICHVRSQIQWSFTRNRVQNLAHYDAVSLNIDEIPFLKVISC